MIKTILQFLIAPLFLAFLSAGAYLTEIQSNGFIQSITVGIIGTLIIIFLLSFQKPSILFIKYRSWHMGVLFGIFIFIQHTIILDFFDPDHLIIDLAISIIVGVLTLGMVLFFRFKNITENTYFALKEEETEIISITASIKYGKNKHKGRLIVTNFRTIFIENNRGRSQYDFPHNDLNVRFKPAYHFGLPYGIMINNTIFELNFPLFWLSLIQNQQKLISSKKSE